MLVLLLNILTVWSNGYYKGINNIEYDFISFSSVGELFKQIYYGQILIPAAERDRDEFRYLLDDLKKYEPEG